MLHTKTSRRLGLGLGVAPYSMDLREWVNDGLMAFFVVNGRLHFGTYDLVALAAAVRAATADGRGVDPSQTSAGRADRLERDLA